MLNHPLTFWLNKQKNRNNRRYQWCSATNRQSKYYYYYYYYILLYCNKVLHVNIDRGFKLRSGQTKDYQIGIIHAFSQKVDCFAWFSYRQALFKQCPINMINIQYTYIVVKYKIHLYSLRNRPEKLAEGSLFCPFLKLVQIDFIFTDNVRILYIYHVYRTLLKKSLSIRKPCKTVQNKD